MKAVDLPYDVKQQLLSQIKTQLGYDQYDLMVNRLGEDGLIDLAFKQMEEMSKNPIEVKKKTWSDIFWTVVFWSFLISLAIAGLKYPEAWWMLAIWVLPAIWGWLSSIISSWWKRNIDIYR